MASPFNVFRKHQKVMLATLAIMAIFAFAFLDPIMALLGSRGRVGRPADRVVLRWDYGEIRQSDMAQMVQLRGIVNNFVMSAARLGAMAMGSEPVMQQGFGPETERDVIQTMVFAKEAEKLGFVVSDDAVYRFIRDITRGSVSTENLEKIYAQTSLGDYRPVTKSVLFDALRHELLARELLLSYIVAADSVTPGERWNTWMRLNDRVVVDVLPVPVSAFLDKIESPPDSTLEAFFNAHKDVLPEPDAILGTLLPSPRPAFKIPRKVTLHYVRADFDHFADLVAPEITDTEIAEYYERNNREFIRAELMDEGGKAPLSDATNQQPPKEESSKEESSKEESSKEESSKEEPPKEEAKDEFKNEGSSNDAAPHGGNGSAPERKPYDQQQGRTGRLDRVPFMLVGHAGGAQDETPPAPAPQPAEPASEPSSSPKEESSSPKEDQTGETATATEAPTEPPGDATAVDGVPVAEETPKASEPAKEPTYKPLEEVKDDIRRNLAQQKTPERIDRALAPLISMMNAHYQELRAWEATQTEGPEGSAKVPRPSDPDARRSAEENGLEYNEIGPMSYFQLRETPPGESMDVNERRPLADRAFTTLRLGEPAVTEEIPLRGHRYVAWKVEDTPERVPKLEEVREEVITAWKVQEARKLARDEAQRLVDQVKQANKPLGEVFSGDEGHQVVQTDPFSWLTLGDVPGGREMRVRLGDVTGVDRAGPEFMETVFRLQPSELVVAMNHAQQVAYVIQLVRHPQSMDELRKDFLRDSEVWDQLARQQHRIQAVTGLFEDLRVAMHVEVEEAEPTLVTETGE